MGDHDVTARNNDEKLDAVAAVSPRHSVSQRASFSLVISLRDTRQERRRQPSEMLEFKYFASVVHVLIYTVRPL